MINIAIGCIFAIKKYLMTDSERKTTMHRVYNWIKDNCYKYGFILRYPEGKEDIDLILDLAFLYDKIADFNSAEKMYKMALDIDNTCAIAYYGLGIIYDDDELYEEAIECYKNAIENDNKYEKAYFFLANAYDELGNKEEAIKNYTEVLKLNSKDLWANANLGCIYDELGDTKLAFKYMEKALELSPKHFRILFNINIFRFNIGKLSIN